MILTIIAFAMTSFMIVATVRRIEGENASGRSGARQYQFADLD